MEGEAECVSSPHSARIARMLVRIKAHRFRRFHRFLYSPEGARRLQTGVLAPGDGFPKTRKPCKGERSFVPSALGLLGPAITGAYTPACSLFSLSGLGMDEQLFSASAIFCCHWGSTFSGQVSAIEARETRPFSPKISKIVLIL